MKKVTLFVICLVSFATTTFLNAQSVAYASTSTETTTYSSTDADPEKIEILTNFKATKQQRKVIKKIKKYVTPRIIGRTNHTDALADKKVKVQVNFSAKGSISAITIVDGMGEKIDARVSDLITEYDQKQSIGSAIGDMTPIQMDIPLVRAQYFVR